MDGEAQMRSLGMILTIVLVFSAATTVEGGQRHATELIASEDTGTSDCTIPATRMGRECGENCTLAAKECRKSCGGSPNDVRFVDCMDCERFRDACICSCSTTNRRVLDGLLFRH
jgi:hypothetical protein